MLLYILAICAGTFLASIESVETSSNSKLTADVFSYDAKNKKNGDQESDNEGNTQVLMGKQKAEIKHLFNQVDGLSKASKPKK